MTDTTRDAFEASFKHLDFTSAPDSWGRPQYIHRYIDALWGGWKAATAQGWKAATKQGKRQPLTEDRVLQAIQSCGVGLQDRISLTFDRGSYEVTEPTAVAMQFARAIEAAHGITDTPQGNLP